MTTPESGRWPLHDREHATEEKALTAALEAEQRRLEAHRESHDAAHTAHEKLHEASERTHSILHEGESKAVLAATTAMDRRLDGMNEFRDQLRDQAATFVRRETMEAEIKTLAAKQEADAKANANAIITLREWSNRADGIHAGFATANAKQEESTTSLKKDVRDLTDRANRSDGSMATWRFIALFMGLPGAVAFVLTVLRMFGGEA